ncbi:MAG: NYN domain-containing protein [Syntrophales bacterium]
MHIIVDGYNLIRQSDILRGYERQSLEAGRKALIRGLARYKRLRGHRITVVFDGWEGGSPQEERDLAGGVAIIYSRLGEKADEVIKRLVAAGSEEILVVTSDREIATHAARRGKSSVDSPEFAARLDRLTAEQPTAEGLPAKPEGADEEDQAGPAKKKGPSRRLSKQKRAQLARIRKL